jgi:hypothetical protein
MKLGAKFEIFNGNSFVIICYNHILCWLNANCFCPLIDIISNYEDEKEKLFMRYEQLSKVEIFIHVYE